MRKELKPQEWREEIDRGLEYRRAFGQEDSWREVEVMFYNLSGSGLGPNLIVSTGDSLLSTLTVPYPQINVRALREEFVDQAPIVQAVDKYLLQELDVPSQIEMACLHAFLWGRGTLKLGYDSEYGYDPDLELVSGKLGPLGTTVSQFDKKGNWIESGRAQPGMPWVQAVLPHDLVVPWGTHEIPDAPWVAHRVVRHVEDIRQDPKYSKTKDIQPSLSLRDFVLSYRSILKPYRIGSLPTGAQQTSEYVELWEIHDRRTRRLYVITSEGTEFLRNDFDALQIDGLPFVSFSFIPAARTFWITPDAFYLKQPQGELDDISVQASKQRRISVPKFIVDETAFAPVELDRMTSPEVGGVVKIKGGFDLRSAVLPFQAPPNMFLANDADYVRRNAREAAGLSRNQLGEYEQRGRRTATEVRAVDAYATRRLGRRETVLKRTYQALFRKLNQVVFTFWRTYHVAPLVGEDAKTQWVRFTGEEIRGEYAYDVALVDEPPMSAQSPRAEALQLYLALREDPTVDPLALREYLTRAYDDPSFERIFRGGVDNAPVGLEVPGMRQGRGKGLSEEAQVG